MHTIRARALAVLGLAIFLAASGGLGFVADGSEGAPLRTNVARVAGGDGAATEGGIASAGFDAAHAFGPVVLVDANDFGGEPGVDVAPDGVIYENAPSGLGGAGGSWVYKSADGGATWTKCGITSGPGGGDSNVAITPQGKIAMNDLWLGSITFYVSDDGCRTWIPYPVSTPVPVGDRQWVEHGWSPCEFFQSWTQIPTGVRVMRTNDCGLTWIDALATASNDLIGNLVVDRSGASQNVYQVYASGGSVWVAVGKVSTTPTGPSLSFTSKRVNAQQSDHDVAQSFPAAAVDAAGNLHVVWHDLVKSGRGRSATWDSVIMYARSSDKGASWSAPVKLSSGGSNVFPWIDAGAAGKAHAVWYHSPTAGNPNNVNGPWFVHLATSTTLGGAWSESRATPVSIHNDVICTSGTGCGGDDRDLLDFFEVAHDAAGNAVIAFTKDTDANGNGNGDPRNAFVRQTGGPNVA